MNKLLLESLSNYEMPFSSIELNTDLLFWDILFYESLVASSKEYLSSEYCYNMRLLNILSRWFYVDFPHSINEERISLSAYPYS